MDVYTRNEILAEANASRNYMAGWLLMFWKDSRTTRDGYQTALVHAMTSGMAQLDLLRHLGVIDYEQEEQMQTSYYEMLNGMVKKTIWGISHEVLDERFKEEQG